MMHHTFEVFCKFGFISQRSQLRINLGWIPGGGGNRWTCRNKALIGDALGLTMTVGRISISKI
jgi:hypothetical protein